MSTNLISFSNYAITFVKQSVLPTITAQQKKILAIASVAFLCLAACYALGRRYLTYENKYSFKNLFNDQALSALPVLDSKDTNTSGYIPIDYPHIEPQEMSSSIMKGKMKTGIEFLAFRILIKIPPIIYNEKFCPYKFPKDSEDNVTINRILILFQRDLQSPKIWQTAHLQLPIRIHPFSELTLNGDSGVQTKIGKESFQRLQTLIKDTHFEYENCTFSLY